MIEMNLVEYPNDGTTWVRPEDAEQMAMFEHCTGYIAVPKEDYKQKYRAIFSLHSIWCKLIPINPKYVINIDVVMKAIEVAEVNYPSTLAFGTASPVTLRNDILNIQHDENGKMSVPRIMQYFSTIETNKMAKGANSGLNFIKNQIKLGREIAR